MKRYEFVEKVFVYMTIEANSEEEAWNKLHDEIELPICQDPRVSYDSVECILDNIEEIENA
jgi:hypothetical protein